MALPFPVPESLSPTFTLSRGTAADTDAMVNTYYESFLTDPRNTFWWSSNKEAMFKWMWDRVARKLSDSATPHFKVTEVESGDLVAFARWDIPEGYAAAFDDLTEQETSIDVSQIVKTGEAVKEGPATSAPVNATKSAVTEYPEGAEPELCKVFFDGLKNMAEKHNTKTMLGLSLLVTSPKYFQRGAAKALMLPMFAIADAQGLKTCLEGTPQGKPIYEKLGFKEVDELVFDLKKLTGRFDEEYKLSIMVREPKSI